MRPNHLKQPLLIFSFTREDIQSSHVLILNSILPVIPQDVHFNNLNFHLNFFCCPYIQLHTKYVLWFSYNSGLLLKLTLVNLVTLHQLIFALPTVPCSCLLHPTQTFHFVQLSLSGSNPYIAALCYFSTFTNSSSLLLGP